MRAHRELRLLFALRFAATTKRHLDADLAVQRAHQRCDLVRRRRALQLHRQRRQSSDLRLQRHGVERHVLVVEINDEGLYGYGQLGGLLRARYCDPNIRGITKTDGLTWKVRDIIERAKGVVNTGVRKM